MGMKIRDCLSKLAEARDAKAKTLDEVQVIVDAATKAGRMDAAGQAKYDALLDMAKTQDLSIKNWEQRLQDALAADGKSMGGGGSSYSFDGDANSVRSGVDRASLDPNGGFASMGDYLCQVIKAGRGFEPDERLKNLAAIPGASMNGNSGVDGGFALPPAYSNDIWTPGIETSSLLPLTQVIKMEKGNSMVFPKVEAAPWSKNGIRAIWLNDGDQQEPTKPKFGEAIVKMGQAVSLVPVVEELLESPIALESFLMQYAPPAIAFSIDEAILFGTGIGQPLGCLMESNKSLITVAKETNQANGSVVLKNLTKMRSQILSGAYRDAVWIVSPDAFPELVELAVGNSPIFLQPGIGIRDDSFDGTLFGRPLILSEHASKLGDAGDVCLVSLKKGYRTLVRTDDVKVDVSGHLWFDAKLMAFRFSKRVGGMPILEKPIQSNKSSNDRSFFIRLGARA